MTPRDLLQRLTAEGLTLTLNLRLEGDCEPTSDLLELVQTYRDDLITYLGSTLPDAPAMCRLSEQLMEGAVWCSRCYRYQLRPCTPSSKMFEDVN